MKKRIFDNLLRYLLLLLVALPAMLIFHESLWAKGVAVAYIFGLWWLVRKPERKEGER